MSRTRALPQIPAMPEQIRSEGQRMLLHVTGSLAAIAREISPKTSPQSVLEWRNGQRTPSATVRPLVYAALGIPPDAWDKRPAGSPEPEPEPDPGAHRGTTLDDCLTLLALIKRDRNKPDLLPGERVKLVNAEAQVLKLRADLEARAELSEDRYVREHPAWLRARNVISAALKDHPEAARAVATALERMAL